MSRVWSVILGIVRTRGQGEIVSVIWMPVVVGEGRTRARIAVRGFGLLRVGNFRRWVDGYFCETLLVPTGATELRVDFRAVRARIHERFVIPVHMRVAPPAEPVTAPWLAERELDGRGLSSVARELSVRTVSSLTVRFDSVTALRANLEFVPRVSDFPQVRCPDDALMMPRQPDARANAVAGHHGHG